MSDTSDLVNALAGLAPQTMADFLRRRSVDGYYDYVAAHRSRPDEHPLDRHSRYMGEFLKEAAGAVPGARNLGAAYNALYDPEHPVTQSNQSTKDAAIHAGLAGFEWAAPWLVKGFRGLSAPPGASKHPNQLGENIHFSMPALLPSWYGIRYVPPKP